MELREYQKRAVTFCLRSMANYQMVDLGLGKTAIALKVIERVKIPTLVLAPLRVAHLTWPDEIANWTPNLSYTILHGRNKDANLKLNRHIYILNYDGLKWFYLACANGKFRLRKFLMIFDESSLVKDPSTLRFKLLKKMNSIMSPYRINLSATPAPGGYHHLWSQYYLLDKGKRLGPTYTPFRDRYFIYYPPPQNRTFPRPFAETEIEDRIRDITFRLEAKDHLELPPLLINNVRVDMPQPLKTLYNKLKTDYTLSFTGSSASAFNDAALSNKCRQLLQGAVYLDQDLGKPIKQYKQLHDIKAQILKEICEISAGKVVLAAIQYRFELEIINKVMKYKVPFIAGGISATESTTILRAWNKGEIPLLLCHPASISHGLNLQSVGHILVWVALTWSLEQYKQTIGRLHRQGQRNSVTVHNVVFKNTVDDTLAATLARKDATQQDLLDAMKEEFYATF